MKIQASTGRSSSVPNTFAAGLATLRTTLGHRPSFVLKRARDPWGPKACECGAVKSKSKPACERCLTLDPEAWPVQERYDAPRRILLALRDGDELTIYEVARSINTSVRNTIRTMHKLVAEGRVRSWLEDQDAEECTTHGLHGRYCRPPTKRYRRIW